jgi:transposase
MARDVAVDVHRKNLFVVIMDEAGLEVLVRRFPTTPEGEAALLQHLQPGDRVVLEATSGVHRLANRLESGGTQVLIADPQEARLVGLRGKKTDYRDCRALLKHLRSGELATIWRPDARTRQLRQLTRERQAYNQSVVRLKNRLRALLWEEGLELPVDFWTESGNRWLTEQPLSPQVRRIVEREWAALRALEALKEVQEQDLAERAQELSDAQQLMQLPGFGAATAVMFLGEVGTVKRFSTAKQLVSYAGLDPRVRQSDARSHRGGVSKAGRRQLRWLMVEVAWAHVIAHGPEADHYHALVQRGKPKGVAITALARRLLTLAYCLLRREENYRELDVTKYEGKLTRLAARRPEDRRKEESHVDWAARRLKELTGHDSPYRQAHPNARKVRKRALSSDRLSSVQARAGGQHDASEEAGRVLPRLEGRRRGSRMNALPEERNPLPPIT